MAKLKSGSVLKKSPDQVIATEDQLAHDIDDHADVSAPSPADGELLQYDDDSGDYVNRKGSDLAEEAGLLAAPAGKEDDWKNRSYEGYEIVDTATTYTVGSGQDFDSLEDAAASLQGLILIEDLILSVVGSHTITDCAFQGLVSSGGRLIIRITDGETLTVDAINGLRIIGPVVCAIVGEGTLQHGSSATRDANEGLVLIGGNALFFLGLSGEGYITWDGNNVDCALTLHLSDQAKGYFTRFSFANTNNLDYGIRVSFQAQATTGWPEDTDPDVSCVHAGLYFIRDAAQRGYMQTAAGVFSPD